MGGAILVAVSLGSYQSDLGCTCVLMISVIICMLSSVSNIRVILKYIFVSLLTIMTGCILYKIIWSISLRITGIEAASYRGANNITIESIISKSPMRVRDAYSQWMEWLIGNSIKHNIFQSKGLFLLPIIFMIILVIINISIKTIGKSAVRIILILIAMLLYPIATNIGLILAPDGGSTMIQMTMPHAMQYPLVFILFMKNCDYDKDGKRVFSHENIEIFGCLNVVFVVIAVFVFYGNFIMVSLDQHIMLKGKEATISFLHGVFYDEEFKEAVISSPEEGFVFLGIPSDNALFRKDEAWDYSNDYARYGQCWTGGNCIVFTYRGLLRDSGIGVPVNWDDSYWHELEQMPEIRDMPVYPEKGFVKYMDDVVVVKISEY